MNRFPPRARRTAYVVLVGCLGLAAPGCGSNNPSARTADPSGPRTSPSSTTPTSPTSATSPTSTAASPAVEPASGRMVSLAAFTARTPRGFDYDNSLAREIVFSSSRDALQNLEYSDVTIYPGTSNAFAARLSIRNSSWVPKPSVSAPVTVDGATFYHLSGPVGHGVRLDEYGSVQGSRLIKVSFELRGTSAQRRRLVDSVLATLQLK